jgi:hypothetical protein
VTGLRRSKPMRQSAKLRSDPEKHREWQRRAAAKTQARQRDKPRKAVKPRNAKRAAATFERCFGKERSAWIRSKPCVVAVVMESVGGDVPTDWVPCMGDVQAAHAVARGGGAAKGDADDQVPMCFVHHDEAGELPGPGRWAGTKREKFETKYRVDLTATAEGLATAWKERSDAADQTDD